MTGYTYDNYYSASYELGRGGETSTIHKNSIQGYIKLSNNIKIQFGQSVFYYFGGKDDGKGYYDVVFPITFTDTPVIVLIPAGEHQNIINSINTGTYVGRTFPFIHSINNSSFVVAHEIFFNDSTMNAVDTKIVGDEIPFSVNWIAIGK